MSQGGVIRLGDSTTGGGTVISCQFASFYTCEGKPVAVLGDMASCRKHNGVFAFVEAESTVSCHGKGTVLQGHKLACGCMAISSVTSRMYINKPAPSFAPVPASACATPPETPAAAPVQALEPTSSYAATPPLGPFTMDEGAPPGEKPDAPILVTLRIGVFFDGTANNADNTRIGAQCRAMAKDAHEEAVLLAGCENADDTSYNNGETNVRKLFELYPDSAQSGMPKHGGDYFVPLYIEGTGTYSGEGDSLLAFGTGGGDSGMVRRVEDAFYVALQGALQKFADDHPHVFAHAIELDVFGFSRGAAAARHFLHKVNQKGHGPLGDVIPGANLKLKPGFSWQSDLRAGFVGLFDSVAHLGLDTNASVQDLAEQGFYMCLPEGCASRGIAHLTARDEHRINFPLTSAAPPYFDLPLPGVHADIGGGYLDGAEEVVWLIRPILRQENAMHALESTRPYREAQQQLQRLQAQDPANAASMSVHCWAVTHPDDRSNHFRWGSVPMQTVAATVQMRRTMSNAYAGIPLRVMHMLASKAGVAWEKSPDDLPNMQLPGELTPVLASAMSYAQMDRPPHLSADDERLLRQRYLHHSASWQISGSNLSPTALAYINRPTDDGKRVVLPNEDKA